MKNKAKEPQHSQISEDEWIEKIPENVEMVPA
jgi:hypothetical protein